MNKTTAIIIVLILLVGNIFFIFQYIHVQRQLEAAQNTLLIQATNENIIAFTQLFISKVLKAEEEVDFETRLQLENTVRGLDDKEILEQWEKFIESENEFDAQNEVKNLLEMLLNKAGAQ